MKNETTKTTKATTKATGAKAQKMEKTAKKIAKVLESAPAPVETKARVGNKMTAEQFAQLTPGLAVYTKRYTGTVSSYDTKNGLVNILIQTPEARVGEVASAKFGRVRVGQRTEAQQASFVARTVRKIEARELRAEAKKLVAKDAAPVAEKKARAKKVEVVVAPAPKGLRSVKSPKVVKAHDVATAIANATV